MPDTSPAPEGPIGALCGRADEHLAELNVALAYVPDLPNREDHLTTVQDLTDALTALQADL